MRRKHPIYYTTVSTQGQTVIFEICRHSEYDEHLQDCIESAFVPLGDLNSAERISKLEAFVAILNAGGLIKEEELEGLVTTKKQPGIQKFLEAVYGKIRTLREADEKYRLVQGGTERVKKAKRTKKGETQASQEEQKRAAAQKACREAYRTVAALELFTCALRHTEIIAAKKEPVGAACGGEGDDEEFEEHEAYFGIQADWFVGSSTNGVTIGGLWAYVQEVNNQVYTLTSCTYKGGRELLLARERGCTEERMRAQRRLKGTPPRPIVVVSSPPHGIMKDTDHDKALSHYEILYVTDHD